MWTKILGGVLVLFGLIMILFFPYISKYQVPQMTMAGVVTGIVVLGIGLLLLKI